MTEDHDWYAKYRREVEAGYRWNRFCQQLLKEAQEQHGDLRPRRRVINLLEVP